MKGNASRVSLRCLQPPWCISEQNNAVFGKTRRPGFEHFFHHILAVLPQPSYLISVRSVFPSVKYGQLHLLSLKRSFKKVEWDTIHKTLHWIPHLKWTPTIAISLSLFNFSFPTLIRLISSKTPILPTCLLMFKIPFRMSEIDTKVHR